MSKSRFWRRREEKRENKARVREKSSFGVIFSPFLPPKGSNNMEGEI